MDCVRIDAINSKAIDRYLPFSLRNTKVPESPPLVPKSEELSPVEHKWNSLKRNCLDTIIVSDLLTH